MRSFLEGCAGERRGCRALLPVPLTSVLRGTSTSRAWSLTHFQKVEGKEKHSPHSFVPARRDPTLNPFLMRLFTGPPSANLCCWGARRNWAGEAEWASQVPQIQGG